MRSYNLVNSFVILFFLCVSTIGASESKDDIFNQKQELEKIQLKVDEGQKKIDSLKSSARNIQKQISEFDQKIESNKKVISRLNSQLKQLEKETEEAEQKLADNNESLNRIKRRYLGNIRQFYFSTQQHDNLIENYINSEVELKRQVIYLASVANFESGNVEQAKQFLTESETQLEGLTGQTEQVSDLKKKKESSTSLEQSKKKQQEKNLNKIRKQEMNETDRVMTLKQAAEEMEKIITRLEKEREEARLAKLRTGGVPAPSVFATLKGQLLSPMRGKVVESFGSQIDPVTKLKSFSPGIKIEGKPSRAVVAVATGIVAYVGNLRGYGNFIIINHDNQYYSTCANLGSVNVTEGQYLYSGEKIADAGGDGIIKFEIRKGREPLDPVEWIKFDSF